MAKNKEEYKPGIGSDVSTYFFRVDSKGKREGFAIRVEVSSNIYSFVTCDKELERKAFWFLKEARPDAEDFLKFTDKNEAFKFIQQFASINGLKPFIYLDWEDR
jgi:hypothetical protein